MILAQVGEEARAARELHHDPAPVAVGPQHGAHRLVREDEAQGQAQRAGDGAQGEQPQPLVHGHHEPHPVLELAEGDGVPRLPGDAPPGHPAPGQRGPAGRGPGVVQHRPVGRRRAAHRLPVAGGVVRVELQRQPSPVGQGQAVGLARGDQPQQARGVQLLGALPVSRHHRGGEAHPVQGDLQPVPGEGLVDAHLGLHQPLAAPVDRQQHRVVHGRARRGVVGQEGADGEAVPPQRGQPLGVGEGEEARAGQGRGEALGDQDLAGEAGQRADHDAGDDQQQAHVKEQRAVEAEAAPPPPELPGGAAPDLVAGLPQHALDLLGGLRQGAGEPDLPLKAEALQPRGAPAPSLPQVQADAPDDGDADGQRQVGRQDEEVGALRDGLRLEARGHPVTQRSLRQLRRRLGIAEAGPGDQGGQAQHQRHQRHGQDGHAPGGQQLQGAARGAHGRGSSLMGRARAGCS